MALIAVIIVTTFTCIVLRRYQALRFQNDYIILLPLAILDIGMTCEGAKSLSVALPSCPALKKLILDCMHCNVYRLRSIF